MILLKYYNLLSIITWQFFWKFTHNSLSQYVFLRLMVLVIFFSLYFFPLSTGPRLMQIFFPSSENCSTFFFQYSSCTLHLRYSQVIKVSFPFAYFSFRDYLTYPIHFLKNLIPIRYSPRYSLLIYKWCQNKQLSMPTFVHCAFLFPCFR